MSKTHSPSTSKGLACPYVSGFAIFSIRGASLHTWYCSYWSPHSHSNSNRWGFPLQLGMHIHQWSPVLSARTLTLPSAVTFQLLSTMTPSILYLSCWQNPIMQRTFICYWVWLPSWDAVLLPTGLQLLGADPEEILPKRFHLNQSNPVKASIIPGKHRFHICGFLIQNTM